VVGLVVDLGLPEPERLPAPANQRTEIAGVVLPRLAVAQGCEPLPLVLEYLHSRDAQSKFCSAGP
jgi:hypothetical protein